MFHPLISFIHHWKLKTKQINIFTNHSIDVSNRIEKLCPLIEMKQQKWDIHRSCEVKWPLITKTHKKKHINNKQRATFLVLSFCSSNHYFCDNTSKEPTKNDPNDVNYSNRNFRNQIGMEIYCFLYSMHSRKQEKKREKFRSPNWNDGSHLQPSV